MKKAIAVILFAFLLGGCGAEWFPEPIDPDQVSATGESVGVLMNFERVGEKNYTVVTSKGVFSTYTSLDVPMQTPVYLLTHTDRDTGALIGKVLRALEQSILVKEVLVLVP